MNDITKREALLIVSALGNYQKRTGQRASWNQRKRLRELRSRLADAVTIGDEQEATGLRKAIANTNRRINSYIGLGKEISALRKRIKECVGIADERVCATEEDGGRTLDNTIIDIESAIKEAEKHEGKG